MALNTNALVTVADVELELKGLDSGNADFPEERIEFFINAASAFIEKYCGNKFSIGDSSYGSDTYEFDGNGKTGKYMRYAPIYGDITVTNISYWDGTQWVALDSTYTIRNDTEESKGLLEFTNGYKFDKSFKWKVVYSYGYKRVDVPDDLKLACIGLVALRFKLFDIDKIGISSWSRGEQSFSYNFNELPEWIRLTLLDHKRYVD